MKNINDLLPYLNLKKGTMPPKYEVKNDFHVLYKGLWVETVIYREYITFRDLREELTERVLWQDLDWSQFTVKKIQW